MLLEPPGDVSYRIAALRRHMLSDVGDPVPVPLPKPALDDAAARQLWEPAEKLTGTAWRVGEPARAFARG